MQVRPKLRERVAFGQLNLCLPIENIGPFDVVFLRNVLIYFDPPTKAAVVDRVLTQLKPGGLFFIGMADTSADQSASPSAIERPMPLLPPVIRATRPDRSNLEPWQGQKKPPGQSAPSAASRRMSDIGGSLWARPRGRARRGRDRARRRRRRSP